ncbi:hypothetical protein COCNU_14G006280 [Cocos nucifera]|uniref:non-specific serine/threonine protein kinase n=1 Tax=Cocos nucifera TaxID=13894 RepID=A0A8K0IV50_COCNU|nr:hypothetical protein COCNU_14G006280 [Cocos nucifera]
MVQADIGRFGPVWDGTVLARPYANNDTKVEYNSFQCSFRRMAYLFKVFLNMDLLYVAIDDNDDDDINHNLETNLPSWDGTMNFKFLCSTLFCDLLFHLLGLDGNATVYRFCPHILKSHHLEMGILPDTAYINFIDKLVLSTALMIYASSAVLSGDHEPMPAKKRVQKWEQRRQQSAVGTPDYLAPEILLGMPHGPTADWWSVGIILFELLVGISPFNAEHPQQIFDDIMNCGIPWPQVPEEMSYEAHDLIDKGFSEGKVHNRLLRECIAEFEPFYFVIRWMKSVKGRREIKDKLLIENTVQRFGATGAGEVKSHPSFKNTNWDMIAKQKAAFIPSTAGEDDTSYFESRHPWNAEDDHVCAASRDFYDMAAALIVATWMKMYQDNSFYLLFPSNLRPHSCYP